MDNSLSPASQRLMHSYPATSMDLDTPQNVTKASPINVANKLATANNNYPLKYNHPSGSIQERTVTIYQQLSNLNQCLSNLQNYVEYFLPDSDSDPKHRLAKYSNLLDLLNYFVPNDITDDIMAILQNDNNMLSYFLYETRTNRLMNESQGILNNLSATQKDSTLFRIKKVIVFLDDAIKITSVFCGDDFNNYKSSIYKNLYHFLTKIKSLNIDYTKEQLQEYEKQQIIAVIKCYGLQNDHANIV